MNKFCWGLGLGLLIGIALWLWSLPGPPSSYHPRFPIATTPLPDEARVSTNEQRVGFDVYTNPKAPAVVPKNAKVPLKKSSTWATSPQRDGLIEARGTLWVEYNGRLYEFGRFKKAYHTEVDRLLVMVQTIAIDHARMVTVTIQYPEIDIAETFGPFRLP